MNLVTVHIFVFLILLMWIIMNKFEALFCGNSGAIKHIIWKIKMNFQSYRIAYAKEKIGPAFDSPNYDGLLHTDKGIFDYKTVRRIGNWDEFMLAALGNRRYSIWIEITIVSASIIGLYLNSYFGVFCLERLYLR